MPQHLEELKQLVHAAVADSQNLEKDLGCLVDSDRYWELRLQPNQLRQVLRQKTHPKFKRLLLDRYVAEAALLALMGPPLPPDTILELFQIWTRPIGVVNIPELAQEMAEYEVGSKMFSRHQRKLAQVIGYLRKKTPKGYKFQKSVTWFHWFCFLADRQSWIETQGSLTGASFYDREPPELMPEPDYNDGQLSEYETKVLDQLWTIFERYEDWQLAQAAQSCPEWTLMDVSHVRYDDILRANGVPEAVIQRVVDDFEYFEAIDKKFPSAGCPPLREPPAS